MIAGQYDMRVSAKYIRRLQMDMEATLDPQAEAVNVNFPKLLRRAHLIQFLGSRSLQFGAIRSCQLNETATPLIAVPDTDPMISPSTARASGPSIAPVTAFMPCVPLEARLCGPMAFARARAALAFRKRLSSAVLARLLERLLRA